MTTDKDRAEFEAFATGADYDLSIEPAFELAQDWPNRYLSKETRNLARGWQAARSRSGAVPAVTDEMVSRFLNWRVPQDFCPGSGVSFKPLENPLLWPTGTDLLHAGQAKAMLEHVLAAPEPPQGGCGPAPAIPAGPASMAIYDRIAARNIPRGYVDGFTENRSAADTPRSGDAPVASIEWRDVPGFEGLYQVSSAGDLKTVHTGIVKLAPPRGGGYVKSVLWKDGRRTQTGMHRLVALAFLDGQLDEVNHKNGDRSDNRVENLEWSTRSHNVSHAHYVLGTNVKPVIARHIESGVERWFPSIEEAGRNGFSPACVYRCAHGLRNKHKGYTWRFDPLVEHSIQQPRATTGDRSDG
jgi:hypothetical protein